jgi:hypothetical protein
MKPYSELDSLVNHVLEGDSLELLDRLSSNEKKVAWEVLQQLKEGGEYNWLNQLWQLDYTELPPTPSQFFNDPNFLLHVGQDLYPKWRGELEIMLNPLNNIHEIVLRGCIGSGKTYVGAAITCYDLCHLMLMKNPQRSLGLTRGSEENTNSPIYYGLISSDLSQLERMLWTYVLQMMKRSPFFRKFSTLKEEKEYKGLYLSLPNNIHLIGGSLPAHILGLNLYGAVLDESNSRRSADPLSQAYDFYLKLRNRVENRFIQTSGKGRIVLVAAESGEGSFLDKHCKSLKETPNLGVDVHICRFSEWEIKGFTMNLSGETFKVDIGDNLRAPHILEDKEEVREGASIVKVPVEYRRSAERDLIEFLKERAGVTPGRANKYFYNISALLNCFQAYNPVLSDIAECATNTPYELKDYFDVPKLIIKVRGKYQPLIDPEALHFMHVDLAKNECFAGLSMCHVSGYSTGGSPIFRQDFCIALKASDSIRT